MVDEAAEEHRGQLDGARGGAAGSTGKGQQRAAHPRARIVGAVDERGPAARRMLLVDAQHRRGRLARPRLSAAAS